MMFPPRHWQQQLRRTVLSPPSTFLEIPSVTRVPRPGASRLQTLVRWHVRFPLRHWQQHLRRTVLSPPSTFGEIPSVMRVPRPGCFQSANTYALACAVSPQALATAVEKNSTIITIDLGENSIGDEGAKARLLPEYKHLCIGMCCFTPGTGNSS